MSKTADPEVFVESDSGKYWPSLRTSSEKLGRAFEAQFSNKYCDMAVQRLVFNFPLKIKGGFEKYEVWINGWQSWSDSYRLRSDKAFKIRKKRNSGRDFSPYTDDKNFGLRSYGVVAIKERETPNISLIGVVPDGMSVSEIEVAKVGQGEILVSVSVWLDEKILRKGRQLKLPKIYTLWGNEKKVCKFFSNKCNLRSDKHGKKLIYFSWSEYGKKVNAKIMYKEMSKLGRKRAVMLLEDGWEKAVGDWEVKKSFGESLAEYCKKINNGGCEPGIWIAPFLVSSHAEAFKRHKYWLLKDREGRLVKAATLGLSKDGSIKACLPSNIYTLDVSKIEVRNYMFMLGRKLSTMGFTFFKLDFLYSAFLKGEFFDKTKTRVEWYRRAIKAIVMGVGNPRASFLACGAPVFETANLGMTIRGSDDSVLYPLWTWGVLGRFLNLVTRAAGVNREIFKKSFEMWSFRRRFLGERWGLIPDAVVCGGHYGVERGMTEGWMVKIAETNCHVTIGGDLGYLTKR